MEFADQRREDQGKSRHRLGQADGEVDWAYQKSIAEGVIEDLLGVKGVTNNIVLKSTSVNTLDLRRKIAEAFHRSATIDSQSIHIDVSGSRLTLTGTVQSWAEREEAARIAWSLPGVLTVDNRIEIKEVFVQPH